MHEQFRECRAVLRRGNPVDQPSGIEFHHNFAIYVQARPDLQTGIEAFRHFLPLRIARSFGSPCDPGNPKWRINRERRAAVKDLGIGNAGG
jgi:hypothetical protein